MLFTRLLNAWPVRLWTLFLPYVRRHTLASTRWNILRIWGKESWSSEGRGQRSPRSPGGPSPSRSRSVWPSYPRTRPASPRTPATPPPGSHSANGTDRTSHQARKSSGKDTHIVLIDPVCTWSMSTTVFTMFHWDLRPSTMTVKPRALHFSLQQTVII